MKALQNLVLRFRRITSSGDYLGAVDGVRFVAITLVFIQHLHERVIRRAAAQYPDVSVNALWTAGPGVFIFFALSGFILFRILEKPFREGRMPDLKKYFLRRLTRLEPPYIVITTLIFLVLTLGLYHGTGKFLGHGDRPFWESYLATITYTHGLLFAVPPSVNPPGWTLEIEVQFYILAPLFVFLLYRLANARWRIIGLIVVILLWTWAGKYYTRNNHDDVIDSPRFFYSILSKLPYFLVGFVVLELRRLHAGKPTAGWVDALAIGGLVALLTVSTGFILPIVIWQCLFIGFFLYGALAGGRLTRLLNWGVLASLGGMCYTLYLIHLPVMELAVKLTSRLGLGMPYICYYLVQAALIIPAVYVVAGILYLLVEQPCMRPQWPLELWNYLRTGRKHAPDRLP